jgi:Tfp pilus assembly protein PilF
MRKSLYGVLFMSLMCLSVGARAQARGGGPPAGVGGPMPPDTRTRPGSIQDSGFYDYWTEMSGQDRAGGALLGKLTVAGEPLPWEPILVTVSCDGKVVYATQTDAGGHFGIVAPAVPGAVTAQSDAQRQMAVHFEGCLVQGSVSGFHSNSITVTQHNLRDDPNLGTLLLSRDATSSATILSGTTSSAPPNAIKAFEKAHAEMIERNPAGAQKDLKKAAEIYPKFAEAWFQLGKLQAASESQAAASSFSKAMQADPKFVLPYEQLAAMAAQEGKWEQVLENTTHVLTLYPDGTPQTWYLNALANFQLGKADVAESSANKSLAIDPRHTVMNTDQLLAVILASQGDYAGALQHLRNSLTYLPPGQNSDLVRQQISQLEQRTAKK